MGPVPSRGDEASYERRIFANRTLNLRSIRAIGYDMDYTLVHYRVDQWEQAAFDHARRFFVRNGWPVDHLAFDPTAVIRGLTIDTATGNLLNVTRFGYVIRATHGTKPLSFEQLRRSYARVSVDLAEPRYQFMNTLFSLSEAWLYAQLVDLVDEGTAPEGVGYADVHRLVQEAFNEAHLGGELKAEILADRERFIELDPDIPLALLDQYHAGKKLLLITNSEWAYTSEIMTYAFDPYLPEGMGWRELFEIVVFSARKPRFFAERDPFYRLVDEDRGLLEPTVGSLQAGEVYAGGHAHAIEDALKLSGDQILYVGDHLFGDVHVSKAVLRWRTALILRELEPELIAMSGFEHRETQLGAMMAEKAVFERHLAQLRLDEQRTARGYASTGTAGASDPSDRQEQASADIAAVRDGLAELDGRIAPLAQAAGKVGNEHWGLLMRAGNDKSMFARQVERYADIYTSRVSNFLSEGPTAYLRAARSTLPHDL